jgi:putative endonuclease
MPIFSRLVFAFVIRRARRGLAEESPSDSAKLAARRVGVRGETLAYWYLRRHGYVIVSRNFMVPGMKGEIDLAGYDGKTLAFIEVKTRQAGDGHDTPLFSPEDAVTPEKRRSVARMAQQFMREWRIKDAAYRFDVLAIESGRGQSPRVRLHKDCFGMSGREAARF